MPGEGVARAHAGTTMETGQPGRWRDEALVGVEALGGAPGHLVGRVLSTLARFEGPCFAYENPISLTGWVLLYCV